MRQENVVSVLPKTTLECRNGGMLCGGCVFVITYTYMYKCRPAVSWRCGSLIVHALYVDYQISNWEMAHSTHDWFTYLISLLC